MGRYTLWCLNRVARWDRGVLSRSLAGGKHTVRLGSRGRFDRMPIDANLPRDANGDGVLMHEELACDEYFVPIVVKCVGDPDRFLDRFGDAMTPDGRVRFQALRDDFPQFYGAAPRTAEWRRYWQTFPIGTAFWRVGMFTRTDGPDAHAGLYEILAREARENDEQAVLVGYSQGGVVARFLAWMDEQLMQPARRAVAGVITVQSPNCGTPLADGRNVDNAGVGLLGAVMGLLGYPIVPPDNRHTRAALDALVAGRLGPTATTPFHFGVGAICALLDAAINDTPRPDPQQTDVLRTCRKWLTGLSPEKTLTAFADLDPSGLDDPRTVLGRLMAAPHQRVFHGAVIGGDDSLEDLVLQGRPCWERWPARWLLPGRWFRAIELAYARISLNEASAGIPRTPLHERIAELYRAGVTGTAAEVNLPPFAHDFAIPAVSQAFYALGGRPPEAPFLGNRLNPHATHISGADPQDPQCDLPYVERMLEDLSRRLP